MRQRNNAASYVIARPFFCAPHTNVIILHSLSRRLNSAAAALQRTLCVSSRAIIRPPLPVHPWPHLHVLGVCLYTCARGEYVYASARACMERMFAQSVCHMCVRRMPFVSAASYAPRSCSFSCHALVQLRMPHKLAPSSFN